MGRSPKHRSRRSRSRHRSNSPNRFPSRSRDSHEFSRNSYNASKKSTHRHGQRSSSLSNSPKNSGSKLKLRENDFDMKYYKMYFDRMFFREYDIIQKGSSQHDDFWRFYDKIQNIQREKRLKAEVKVNASTEKGSQDRHIFIGNVQVPEKYAKKYTIPFSMKDSDPDDYICRLNPDDQEYFRAGVTKEIVSDFIQILIYFLDFLQKEKFTKLRKLREGQAALPIAQFREQILTTLEKCNVLIIAGDTGCGKSTQVPQYLLRANYKNIACTQPRRIACLSLCKRVAYETLNEFGSEIGYQIRFEKHKTQHTKLVFITEGLLLRQVSTESLLTNYNVIVLDEVHERHLHGDFLLGIVKCLLYQRNDVKIILMSATINTELFQNYFQGLAPIVQVPGRLFPIKMQYRPVSVEELNSRSSKLNPAPYVRILQLIDDKFPQDERGDVLVFLSGMNEINSVMEAAQLYAEQTKRWIILPLHSSLSIDDQDKAFDYPPEGVRKCIISTNIAETSITIDGIRFVVDSGKVKEMAYDPNSKMQRLKEFWISKASAEQRKGRAGRTGPGVCYRLYSENEYEELQAYSTPEIQRVPLDSLLLQMISIGIPDCRKFPFIEPPMMESIESSVLRLQEQNALTDDECLTEMGKTLSQLPVDVTIGKMLIMGTLFHQIEAVLSLAGALSVQSPFTNWAHRDPDCVAARKSLDSDHGDPITLLNSYRAWLEEKGDQSGRTKKWCKRRGFEEQRFYEMTKLRQQFQTLLKDSGLILDKRDTSAMSSSERAMRHGEMKHLRTLKREYHTSAPRKKKFLKIEDGFDAGDESDQEHNGDGQIDIRDVEFRLRNDSRQVKDLLHQSTPYGHQDLIMLKVILCSGIYPQVAIADDFNKHKSDADQVYHTRGKGFTVLHPMSIFANQPDVLKLTESDIILVPHMATKLAISSKHQLVCFLTLLETNKPYLMNTFRMPAVQTLLLFAHSIDLDNSFTRFVFDSWLEIEFADSVSARLMVTTATELRDTWTRLLNQRLTQKEEGLSSVEIREGRQLNEGLVTFLRSETFYTIRRLMAADQKDLYNRSNILSFEIPNCNIQIETGYEISHNLVKGGIKLTSYLNYGCLYGEDPEIAEWECPSCLQSLSSLPLELFLHQCECTRKKRGELKQNEEVDILMKVNKPFSNVYICPDCQKELYLTPMEILRHRKEHS